MWRISGRLVVACAIHHTLNLLRIAYKPHLLPALNQEVGERYAIPPLPPAAITYSGLPLDEVEDALKRSVAMQTARGILVRKQQKMSGRPVTPLHKGHVGLGIRSQSISQFLYAIVQILY